MFFREEKRDDGVRWSVGRERGWTSLFFLYIKQHSTFMSVCVLLQQCSVTVLLGSYLPYSSIQVHPIETQYSGGGVHVVQL